MSGPLRFSGGAGGGVESVFGRTGSVSAQNGDYSAAQVAFQPFGALTDLTVQAAIESLAAGKNAVTVNTFADLPDPTTVPGQKWWVRTSSGVWLVNRHPKGAYYSDGSAWSYLGDFPQSASEVSNTPAGIITGTNVQAALDELGTELSSADLVRASNLATVVNTFLAQTTRSAMRTTGLGGGASGVAAFTAANPFAFLQGAGVTTSVVLGEDAAAAFPTGADSYGTIALVSVGISPSWSTLLAGRANASPQCALLGTYSGIVRNTYTTPLNGTTGADDSLNFSFANDGNFYVENRISSSRGFTVSILRGG